MQNLFSRRSVRLSLTLSALFLAIPAFAADPAPVVPLQPFEPAPTAATAPQPAPAGAAIVPAAPAQISSPAPAPAADAAPASATAVPAQNVVATVEAQAPVPPIPAALGGAWKGTFVHRNNNKTEEQDTYRVEVDVRQPSITVIQVPAPSGTVVHSGITDALKPITRSDWQPAPGQSRSTRAREPFFAPDLQPSKWDGRTLEQSVHENSTSGRVQISLGKHLSIALEPDGKHARFSYEVEQIRVYGGTRTETVKTQGSGILSRAK